MANKQPYTPAWLTILGKVYSSQHEVMFWSMAHLVDLLKCQMYSYLLVITFSMEGSGLIWHYQGTIYSGGHFKRDGWHIWGCDDIQGMRLLIKEHAGCQSDANYLLNLFWVRIYS